MTQFSGKRFVSVFSLIVALTGCDPLPPLENNSDGGMMNSDAMTPDAGPICTPVTLPASATTTLVSTTPA